MFSPVVLGAHFGRESGTFLCEGLPSRGGDSKSGDSRSFSARPHSNELPPTPLFPFFVFLFFLILGQVHLVELWAVGEDARSSARAIY